jgi:hypothetical protein
MSSQVGVSEKVMGGLVLVRAEPCLPEKAVPLLQCQGGKLKRQRLSHDLRRLPLDIGVESQTSLSLLIQKVDQLIFAALVYHASSIGAEVVRQVVKPDH